jgi:hypothetical protein
MSPVAPNKIAVFFFMVSEDYFQVKCNYLNHDSKPFLRIVKFTAYHIFDQRIRIYFNVLPEDCNPNINKMNEHGDIIEHIKKILVSILQR